MYSPNSATLVVPPTGGATGTGQSATQFEKFSPLWGWQTSSLLHPQSEGQFVSFSPDSQMLLWLQAGITGQSAGQLELSSPLSGSHDPLLLHPQSAGHEIVDSPKALSHTPLLLQDDSEVTCKLGFIWIEFAPDAAGLQKNTKQIVAAIVKILKSLSIF
jgi:hypothetical protein